MATVACYPVAPRSLIDSCVISCDAADSNDDAAFNADLYPASPEIRYYLEATLTGQDALRSEVFSTDIDGAHAWTTVIFPAAGSWTITLRDASDDSSVATASPTVS